MCAWHFGQTVLCRSCPADRLNSSRPWAWAWRRCAVTGAHCLQKSVPFRLSPSLLGTGCQHVNPVQNAFDVETGPQHNTLRAVACWRFTYRPTAECDPRLLGANVAELAYGKISSCVPALQCPGKPYENGCRTTVNASHPDQRLRGLAAPRRQQRHRPHFLRSVGMEHVVAEEKIPAAPWRRTRAAASPAPPGRAGPPAGARSGPVQCRSRSRPWPGPGPARLAGQPPAGPAAAIRSGRRGRGRQSAARPASALRRPPSAPRPPRRRRPAVAWAWPWAWAWARGASSASSVAVWVASRLSAGALVPVASRKLRPVGWPGGSSAT